VEPRTGPGLFLAHRATIVFLHPERRVPRNRADHPVATPLLERHPDRLALTQIQDPRLLRADLESWVASPPLITVKVNDLWWGNRRKEVKTPI
jgi:hypothetical protein